MEWSERGLILGLKKHGETSVILELMTRAHGRHLGVVRGGRSKSMQPVLQPGNEVAAVWRARLEEHLGLYAVEAAALRTDLLLSSPQGLHGVNWLGGLLRLLPERDPHPGLYDRAQVLFEHLTTPLAPALFVHFELALLAELGFGLDLEQCAATGRRDDLIYVSPKSGRAVSREAGAPWAARLLPLPAFVLETPGAAVEREKVREGFRLTEYFLVRDVFAPRGLTAPDSRAAFIARF
ncbi:DNA repair protein RecO [Rhodoblastus acidophilus]|uniref:DNA repair protein RecO n=1 Tax=Candidatus Rhodoblastus alkanivorans TaxID=2954117 RepID=A0ABS9Z5V5_9HYPH|nr:DNA repair protein RecO [Candidatus Rhodoblastus alkanivorans]MCI4678645.1 DNA repair protein RecO [Candidatus Rhodoblastus alkanivorans]MCI4683054.1 DNA repair protein RecO [Candidatus Rhodoblastus alkanivorans]MDI4640365.1 DNA repair protein RecO [Rhodoblastus acidophilus]